MDAGVVESATLALATHAMGSRFPGSRDERLEILDSAEGLLRKALASPVESSTNPDWMRDELQQIIGAKSKLLGK
jgi:hypothetical protein